MDECDSTLGKTCTKCKLVKPCTEFHKDKQRSDGLRPSCKLCKLADQSEYRKLHPEKGRAYAIGWAAANADRKKAAKAAWRAANREKVNAEAAAYRLKYPEKIKAADFARYHRDPKTEKARIAAYKAANPDKGRQHVQNRRAKVRGNGGKLSKDLTSKLFALQKGKCPCCAQPLGDDFHLDHKMPLALGGSNTDDNMQLLRAVCNATKRAKHPVDYMQSKGFLL